MTRIPVLWLGAAIGFTAISLSSAADNPPSSRPALTRPEMKLRLEALKQRSPRLPLPELTAEERASGRSSVNNGRLRATYLPASWRSFAIAGWGGTPRPSSGKNDPPTGNSTANVLKTLQQQPDYAFKTRLFWIVSRGNDCQYCLGHQELKLRKAGMSEDAIASLDCRWETFPKEEQAALALAKRMTLSPHQLTEADIERLKPFYDDAKIIDIAYTIARYNAVNRWTDSTGIPQDQSFGGEENTKLDTTTSAEFASVPTQVAPVDLPVRPEWERYDVVLRNLDAAKSRTPLVKLPSQETAQTLLAADTPGVVPPQWFRAVSQLPVALDAWRQRQGRVRDGLTDERLRPLISYVSARENRAWYAVAHARARYLAIGGSEADLADFASLEQAASKPGHAEALRFARKLTSAPHTIEDADVARLRENFSDHEVAEIIDLTCDANAFDRFTEVLRLPVEF